LPVARGRVSAMKVVLSNVGFTSLPATRQSPFVSGQREGPLTGGL